MCYFKRLLLLVVDFYILITVNGKIYDACDLASVLHYQLNLQMDEVANWVCIAKFSSNLNSSAYSFNGHSNMHGIFQISEEFCKNSYECNGQCENFLDDEISDDFACNQKIYAKNKRTYGNGYQSWPVYNIFCDNGRSALYINNCGGDLQPHTPHIGYTPLTTYNNHPIYPTAARHTPKKGKVYTKCELAKELRDKHLFPVEEIATWVCIAFHESRLDTSAVGRLNTDGSADHGLFQISDLWWCSPPGKGKGCQASCDQFEDSDIADDVACVKTIKAEHDRLFGNGFTAWTVYEHHCAGNTDHYLSGCGEFSQSITINPHYITNTQVTSTSYHKAPKSRGKVYTKCELAMELRDKHLFPVEEIATWVCIAYHESRLDTSAVGRLNTDGSADHGLFQISDLWWCSPPGKGKGCQASCDHFEDSDIADDVACVKTIKAEHDRLFGNGFTAWTVYEHHCAGNTDNYLSGCGDFFSHRHTTNNLWSQKVQSIPQSKYLNKKGKIYTKCDLADELLNQHNFPVEEIATWVCIAYHESRLDTSAVGRLNADGSADHGLFQISDLWWCSPPGKGKGCHASCDQFEDSDITDDVACVRTIKAEHDRLSGNGFTAWTVYNHHCSHNVDQYLVGCSLKGFSKSTHNHIAHTSPKSLWQKVNPTQRGKVYNKCELAKELLNKYHLPQDDISTWVCIAYHESRLDTSAVGRLNTDGSADHGLFQISDLWWCSPPGNGKGCSKSCDFFEDSDISDDVECIKLIKAEHDRINGNGFTAWTVYNTHCAGNTNHYIDGCFENDIDQHHPYSTTHYNTIVPATVKKPKPIGNSYSIFSKFIDKPFVAEQSQTSPAFNVFKGFVDKTASYTQASNVFQTIQPQEFSIFKNFVDKPTSFTPEASQNTFSIFKNFINKPVEHIDQSFTLPSAKSVMKVVPPKATTTLPPTTTKKYETISRTTAKTTKIPTTKQTKINQVQQKNNIIYQTTSRNSLPKPTQKSYARTTTMKPTTKSATTITQTTVTNKTHIYLNNAYSTTTRIPTTIQTNFEYVRTSTTKLVPIVPTRQPSTSIINSNIQKEYGNKKWILSSPSITQNPTDQSSNTTTRKPLTASTTTTSKKPSTNKIIPMITTRPPSIHLYTQKPRKTISNTTPMKTFKTAYTTTTRKPSTGSTRRMISVYSTARSPTTPIDSKSAITSNTQKTSFTVWNSYSKTTTTKKPSTQHSQWNSWNVVKSTTKKPITKETSRRDSWNNKQLETTTTKYTWNNKPTENSIVKTYQLPTTNQKPTTTQNKSLSSVTTMKTTSQITKFPVKSKSDNERRSTTSKPQTFNIFDIYLKNYKT